MSKWDDVISIIAALFIWVILPIVVVVGLYSSCKARKEVCRVYYPKVSESTCMMGIGR